MNKLTRSDLINLETYAERREEIRRQVIEHKRRRRLILGPHASLHFEDKTTMWYQVQEMLRTERIFEAPAIQEEIDTYNPLIPDGTNWKATFLIEYADPSVRDQELTKMPGVEHRVWVGIDGFERVMVNANDDMDRTNETKTAAVHFLRFEFSPEQIKAMHADASIRIGIDHPNLPYVSALDHDLKNVLVGDLVQS